MRDEDVAKTLTNDTGISANDPLASARLRVVAEEGRVARGADAASGQDNASGMIKGPML